MIDPARHWGLRVVRLVAAMLAVIILAAGAGWAEDDHDRARALREAGEILPAVEIIQHALDRHPGQVFELELVEAQGGYVYEVEILDTDGVLWKLHYDSLTGKLIEAETETEKDD